jgi:hypothetical protein
MSRRAREFSADTPRSTGQPGSGFSYRSTRQPWGQQSPPAQRGDLAVMLVCAIIAVVIIGIILAGQ